MGRRIQKIKKFLNRALWYIIERARSDEYYDHRLVERIRYRHSLHRRAKHVEDAIRLQQLPIGDRIIGSKGDTRNVDEVLSYKHNTAFLRSRKGKIIAIYTLKKKSDTLAYLVSEEMGPIEVKKL